MLEPQGGAIAYIGATRTVFGYNNDYFRYGLVSALDKMFCQRFFSSPKTIGEVWGESITEYINIYDIQYHGDGGWQY